MIICPKCGKENQDHYKFCLGCGAELPRDVAPKAYGAHGGNTPPHGSPAMRPGGADGHGAATPLRSAGLGGPAGAAAQASMQPGGGPGLAARPSAPGPAPGQGTPGVPPAAAPARSPGCPQCGHVNPAGVRFCMSCGFNLAIVASAPPAPQAAPAPSLSAVVPGEPVATLTALRADKSEVGSFPFSGSVTVGRDTGGIFSGDSYLSPRHATFNYRSGRFVIRDELSLNGTFVKLIPDQPVELKPGDIFRIGQEIIRFEALQPQPPSPDGVERLGSPSKGYVGRLALIVGRDVTGNAFPVPESGVHLGRERGDILFPEDGYVSGLHCRIRAENGRVTLTDLGSSNGTFLRLTSEYEIRSGEEVLMGQQLFRLTF
ncbi:MAG TPA: FHA domain-containing protein [Polyangiaceae bacterium]|nr:FHA domain-containing protein [Polyangiaceae bacterium]